MAGYSSKHDYAKARERDIFLRPAPIQDILNDLPGLVVYHQVMVR